MVVGVRSLTHTVFFFFSLPFPSVLSFSLLGEKAQHSFFCFVLLLYLVRAARGLVTSHTHDIQMHTDAREGVRVIEILKRREEGRNVGAYCGVGVIPCHV